MVTGIELVRKRGFVLVLSAMSLTKLQAKKAIGRLSILLPALLVFVLSAFLSWVFYVRSTTITEQQIKSHIRSLASTAAVGFDASDIERLRKPADMNSQVYRRVVNQLMHVAASDSMLEYAYILRKTDEPGQLTFVADADSLDTPELLDKNGNGMVDDNEKPSLLGDGYDATQFPDMLEGFSSPSVDRQITVDDWGAFISGYAPIRNEDGETVAILGLDMNAQTFLQLSRSIFSPVALIVVLMLCAFCGVLVLFALWRQRFAALRLLEESKSRFLTASSHQLRTPLTAINWTFDSLPENGPLTEEQANMIRDARAASKQMASTIDTMLHIATIESGKQNIEASGVFILTLLTGLKEKTRKHWEAKKLTVTVDCAEHTRSLTDEKILTEVLGELLENAILYTPEGGSVSLKGVATPTGVRILVSDTGIGIPPNERQHIFTKFFRGELALKVYTSGDGLGLYLSQSLVSILGGTLNFESKKGEGTTFETVLPDAYL